MTTAEALLAAVLANPADDLPRLVYADYLEENGEAERAEFIRVQVELSRVPGYPKAWDGDEYPRVYDLHPRQLWLLNEWDYRRGWRKLAGRDACRLIPDGAPWYDHITFRRGFVAEVRCTLAEWCGVACPVCTFRRGFVAEVRCTLAEWCGVACPVCGGIGDLLIQTDYGSTQERCMTCNGTGRIPGIGPAVVRSHPVEFVRVSGVRPWVGNYSRNSGVPDVYGWWYGHPQNGQDTLPNEVIDIVASDQRRLPTPQDYRTGNGGHGGVFFAHESTAVSALSSALIAWAKSQPHPARITTSPVTVDVTR